MTNLLVLSASDVRRVLDLDELRNELARALAELSAGRASAPARVAAFTEAGLLGSMPGYLPGRMLAAKLVSVFPANHAIHLPSHHALIAVFDPDTGAPLAVLDGTYITAVRTAGASAVAAGLLARPDARVAAILGAGVQGQAHLEALAHVGRFAEIRVASRDSESARALAGRDPRARAADSFDDAVRGADVVCCCTDAREPVVRREWLGPGAHVGSVGTGAELDPATVHDARLFVEWRGAATNPAPAGAVELQGIDPADLTEIGEVVAGSRPGRETAEELTVYKSTGHAVEDVAVATLVYRRAAETGIGTTVAFGD